MMATNGLHKGKGRKGNNVASNFDPIPRPPAATVELSAGSVNDNASRWSSTQGNIEGYIDS